MGKIKLLRNEYIKSAIKIDVKFQWQKSFYDRIPRNQQEFNNKLNYINTNHLKHNLPTDWKYIGYNYEDLIDLI